MPRMIVNSNDGLEVNVHANLQGLDADDHPQYAKVSNVLGEPSFQIVAPDTMEIQMRWVDGSIARGMFGFHITMTIEPFPFGALPSMNFADCIPAGIDIYNGDRPTVVTYADGTVVITASAFESCNTYVWVLINDQWYSSPVWEFV